MKSTIKKKPKIMGGVIRSKPYHILQRAIEEGIRWGWAHAHKHTDKPTEEDIFERLEEDIMFEICEVFDFEEQIHA